MSSAFSDFEDREDAQGIELSENVAEDFLDYFRGNVVGHEEEGYLMWLSLLTGWTASESTHNNVLGMGEPGSGKSLTLNTVENLFDDYDTYTKTSASDNAILDSQEWDLALAAPMDELDKIDKPIQDILKSSNPEDGGYSKDRNVEDPDAPGGWSPTEVSAEANPWAILFVPSSMKNPVNDELEDRALVLYFTNNKHTRRGIGRKEFGHEDIDIETADDEHEFIYDTHSLAARLRGHIRELPVAKHYEENDDGDQYVASRTGDTHVYMPWWVWYVCEPIFDLNADETNRVYGLVANCIKASALSNHKNRERRDIDVYIDEDSAETETREAVVVGPQDVANVLACLPTLLSTTHQLTPLKRHVLDAVDATEQATSDGGTTVSKVQKWLDANDIPHPSRQTLKDRLDDLSEEYYLERFDSAGGPNGRADVYQKPERGVGALQTPRITDLQRHADRDDVQLGVGECVDIDPSDPFADCTDPIRDQSFVQTVQQFEAEFSGETEYEDPTTDTTASTFMSGDGESGSSGSQEAAHDGESEDDGEGGGQQSALTDVSSEGDMDSSDDPSIDVDPDGPPENPTQEWLYDNLEYGGIFGPRHDPAHRTGICERNGSWSETGQDLSGTPVDPTHELWQDRADMTDDRVIDESDAMQELTTAYRALLERNLVVEDADGGPEAMHTLKRVEVDDKSDE